QGFCLYYKVLERGPAPLSLGPMVQKRRPWPSPADGTAHLTAAQLAMLWEGIDWRRPAWTSAPTRVA
ncbi:MAG: hypothetical protein AAGI34_19890, partial [Pseudomonadota bacterium]